MERGNHSGNPERFEVLSCPIFSCLPDGNGFGIEWQSQSNNNRNNNYWNEEIGHGDEHLLIPVPVAEEPYSLTNDNNNNNNNYYYTYEDSLPDVIITNTDSEDELFTPLFIKSHYVSPVDDLSPELQSQIEQQRQVLGKMSISPSSTVYDLGQHQHDGSFSPLPLPLVLPLTPPSPSPSTSLDSISIDHQNPTVPVGAPGSSGSGPEHQPSSFTFTDPNGDPLTPESLAYFSRLRVVYATAVVAANSTPKLLEKSHPGSCSSKSLLLFSEVGALTQPNELGKTKLVTIRLKPNQLLNAGQHQVLKLSLPPTEQIFDVQSAEASQFLSQPPTMIPVQDSNPMISLIPIHMKHDQGRQFTANATFAPFPFPFSNFDPSFSCQVVTNLKDTVICQQLLSASSKANSKLINNNSNSDSNSALPVVTVTEEVHEAREKNIGEKSETVDSQNQFTIQQFKTSNNVISGFRGNGPEIPSTTSGKNESLRSKEETLTLKPILDLAMVLPRKVPKVANNVNVREPRKIQTERIQEVKVKRQRKLKQPKDLTSKIPSKVRTYTTSKSKGIKNQKEIKKYVPRRYFVDSNPSNSAPSTIAAKDVSVFDFVEGESQPNTPTRTYVNGFPRRYGNDSKIGKSRRKSDLKTTILSPPHIVEFTIEIPSGSGKREQIEMVEEEQEDTCQKSKEKNPGMIVKRMQKQKQKQPRKGGRKAANAKPKSPTPKPVKTKTVKTRAKQIKTNTTDASPKKKTRVTKSKTAESGIKKTKAKQRQRASPKSKGKRAPKQAKNVVLITFLNESSCLNNKLNGSTHLNNEDNQNSEKEAPNPVPTPVPVDASPKSNSSSSLPSPVELQSVPPAVTNKNSEDHPPQSNDNDSLAEPKSKMDSKLDKNSSVDLPTLESHSNSKPKQVDVEIQVEVEESPPGYGGGDPSSENNCILKEVCLAHSKLCHCSKNAANAGLLVLADAATMSYRQQFGFRGQSLAASTDSSSSTTALTSASDPNSKHAIEKVRVHRKRKNGSKSRRQCERNRSTPPSPHLSFKKRMKLTDHDPYHRPSQRQNHQQ